MDDHTTTFSPIVSVVDFHHARYTSCYTADQHQSLSSLVGAQKSSAGLELTTALTPLSRTIGPSYHSSHCQTALICLLQLKSLDYFFEAKNETGFQKSSHTLPSSRNPGHLDRSSA